jgi:hypothetical protein
MYDNLINENIKIDFLKKSLFYLKINKNYNVISNDDKIIINGLKNEIDNTLFKGSTICTFTYIFFKKVISNNKMLKYGLIKNSISNKTIEFLFIIASAKIYNDYHNYIFTNKISNKLEKLKTKYGYLIKNSILNNDDPNLSSSGENLFEKFRDNYIHQHDYFRFYFIFLLILRVIV